jgi:hypothetical protein
MQYSVAQFILDHGMKFKTDGRSFPRLGRMKECFKNSFELAASEPDLIYCEGYALGAVIAVHHAWCVRKDGTVVDPTWKSGEDYFGVPLRLEYVVKFIDDTGCYDSVIEDYRRRFPLLTNRQSGLWTEAVNTEFQLPAQ